jgi:hypothetical protein
MGRKKKPERERKMQLFLNVKKKYAKEATEKLNELQTYFDLKQYEGIINTEKD